MLAATDSRLIPTAFEVNHELVMRQANRAVRRDGENKIALWDIRKTQKIFSELKKEKPSNFFKNSPKEKILELAQKLVNEGKGSVQVNVLKQEDGTVAGHPKVFFTFAYNNEEHKLCSTHFIS